jgi:hypothetical protein
MVTAAIAGEAYHERGVNDNPRLTFTLVEKDYFFLDNLLFLLETSPSEKMPL